MRDVAPATEWLSLLNLAGSKNDCAGPLGEVRCRTEGVNLCQPWFRKKKALRAPLVEARRAAVRMDNDGFTLASLTFDMSGRRRAQPFGCPLDGRVRALLAEALGFADLMAHELQHTMTWRLLASGTCRSCRCSSGRDKPTPLAAAQHPDH